MQMAATAKSTRLIEPLPLPGNFLPASPPDGFQRALDADAMDMDYSISRAHASADRHRCLTEQQFERLRNSVQELYTKLRSPIFPKRGHEGLANSLYDGVRTRDTIDLHIVLASPTALAEICQFLDVVGILHRSGCNIAAEVHLVRWENYVDVSHLSETERSATFKEIEVKLNEEMALSGYHYRVSSLEMSISEQLADIDAPQDIKDLLALLETGQRGPCVPDISLARNLRWITGFYARQRSLARLGEKQPIIDLAIRTGVGRRVFQSQQRSASSPIKAILLTSELNRGFLPCYGDQTPIVNIALTRS